MSERVEPWMTPVAPINWTQVSMVDTVPFHSPHLLTYLARAFSARWNCFSASSLDVPRRFFWSASATSSAKSSTMI